MKYAGRRARGARGELIGQQIPRASAQVARHDIFRQDISAATMRSRALS